MNLGGDSEECLELWFKDRLMEVCKLFGVYVYVRECVRVCVCIPVILRETESQRSGQTCLEFQLESKEQTKRDERKS